MEFDATNENMKQSNTARYPCYTERWKNPVSISHCLNLHKNIHAKKFIEMYSPICMVYGYL